MSQSISRRRFLAGARDVGLGVAALSVAGPAAAVLDSGVASASPRISLPPVPAAVHTYVSRPDLRPTGISTSTVTGFRSIPNEPAYIFCAPRQAPSETFPANAQQGVMITDRRGDLVWFLPLTSPHTAPFNFTLQTYKGQPVLTWFQGTIGPGYGVGGTYEIYDSSYSPVTSFEAVNYPSDLHEFLITPQDTALVTAYETPSRSGGLIIGHAQEIDIASNGLIFDWPSYPSVPESWTYSNVDGDYFHINSIDLWPGSERDFFISSRNTHAVYRVSRRTKRIVWVAGGKHSSFDLVGNSTRFEWQHDARALPDGAGFSLFDDASQPGPEKNSWGKVFRLDTTTRKVTLLHQYEHTTAPVDAANQGNVQVLGTGGHCVGFGNYPYFSEYAPSGNAVEAQMVLDGRFYPGVDSYRTFMFDWTGHPPLSEFALVVHKGSASGSFVAWMSWNGATEVAHYTVAAGTSSSTLRTVATLNKSTFETRAAFTASGATQFQVTAHSSTGQVLGQTEVVSAT